MATYSVMVRIEEECRDSAVASIRAACKGAAPAPVLDGDTLYMFQANAHTTANEVRARLSEIRGVRVVNIVPIRLAPAVTLRRHLGWLCVAGAWASLYAASVAVPDNPLEHLNNFQEILIHSAMAIAIAAWAYRAGRKSARGLSRDASAAMLAAYEAGERAERAARSGADDWHHG